MSSSTSISFWKEPSVWRRSARNTFHCFIGCNIGDVGMLIFLQVYYPSISLGLNMILPMSAGIMTSLLLETLILLRKEGFKLWWAFRTALSMSLISMLAMEFTENSVDFILTGRTTPIDTPWYWIALVIALCAGFLVPWPYNYYQLKKYQKHCH